LTQSFEARAGRHSAPGGPCGVHLRCSQRASKGSVTGGHMPSDRKSVPQSGPERAASRKLEALEQTFAQLLRELSALPEQDRTLVLSTTFLHLSNAVLHSRTCAAALKCAAELESARDDSDRLAS